jgi:signal transduction histidine kinase
MLQHVTATDQVRVAQDEVSLVTALLFERFFSAPTDAAGHRAGTGLGLPLALAIAQAHGGTIDVASTLCQGSTFTLRVPAEGPLEDDEA